MKFFNRKISTQFKNEKKSFTDIIKKLSNINRNKQNVLIFHAASAGEFEQLVPILKKINRKKFFIIQTFTSPTVFDKESTSKLFDASCYHPYDFFWKSYYFFSKIKPIAYIVTRHDVWPSHLFVLNRLNIKTFYINANLHNNSLWVKKSFHFITKSIFNNLNFCLVPSETIKNKFSQFIDVNKIHITGDSRFDQIIDRKNKNTKISILENMFHQSFNIIFGSYDKQDEALIINSLSKYYLNGEKSLEKLNHKIILVPHEINMDDVNQMIFKLQKNHFKPHLFSNVYKQNTDCVNCLIIDQVGILADVYRYTKLAYVGSGFSDGVHSVIEPGVHKNVVSFGPNIELLHEAKYLYKHKIAYMIKNTENMLDFFNLYKDYHTIEMLGKDIEEYIYKQQGASDEIVQFIETHL